MKRDWTEFRGVGVEPAEVHADERGNLTKLADVGDGDNLPVRQVVTAHNRVRGTVRGLHVQLEPSPETKRLWCVRGEILDVLVDVRPMEPTYGDWTAIPLDGEKPDLVTIPPGVAHGYQTLTDDTLVVYLIDGTFDPIHSRALRWDDPAVGIEWPLEVTAISERDRAGLPWPLS